MTIFKVLFLNIGYICKREKGQGRLEVVRSTQLPCVQFGAKNWIDSNFILISNYIICRIRITVVALSLAGRCLNVVHDRLGITTARLFSAFFCLLYGKLVIQTRSFTGELFIWSNLTKRANAINDPE